MGNRVPLRYLAFFFLLLTALITPGRAAASEQMCDPSFQDCRTILLTRIQNETQALDIAMLFMEDDAMADAIIARHRAGVRVRMLIEPRRSLTTPKNEIILDRLKAAGIPMRAKNGGGMLHWKFMIFDAQNSMEFSAANYSDFYFAPTVPYSNYTDEGIYFTDQTSLVDSFRRKFDDAWVDPAAFLDYGNITAPPARRYPLYAIDPDLSFVPFENFATRSVPFYDNEQVKIDTVMYKITDALHTDGIIRAAQRGVPVRLIVEGERYRNKENFWQAYQVDRLYMAGVQIRDRAHEGFLHQKSTLLYGQAMTIYGSANWTNESNAKQYEHNYFTSKPWFFEWFRQNFERKWNNSAGAIETVPFRPLPPDPPLYVAPANGATGVPTTGASLQWNPGMWGWTADLYFGTSPSPPLLAADITATPNEDRIFTLPALNPGTTYYWKVVSKTAARQGAAGAVYSFTTAGGSPPPPPPPNALPTVSITSPAANAAYTAPATVAITANASDSDGTVTRVDFYASGTFIGSDTSSPFQFTWSGVGAGSYTLTARATDNSGGASTSSGVPITVSNPPPPATLPAPWQSQDIGAVGPAGSASATTTTFTVSGGGADVWGSADALHFAWQRLSGDADVIARVATVENVNVWTKAGVMIRERLTADSAQAFMLVSPGRGLAFQRRVAQGGLSTNTSGGAGTAPAWVKLERRANTITASVSADGTNWTTVGSDTFAMGAEVHVGLAVSSHDATRLATATFDGLAIRAVAAPPPPPPPPPPSGVPAPWSAQDVGAVGTAGSASASGSSFTVAGAGADVWGSADAFQYVWQPLTGDADVVARVTSVEYVQAWVKAGVMIRERLTADAPHAFMLVSAGKGIAFQRRVSSGGVSTNTAGAFGTAPAWVKLQRRGNVISAFQSNDGAAWSLVGQDTFTMPSTVYVGLAVSSHDPSRTATATFDNVVAQAVSAPPPPPPPSTAIKEIVIYASDATAVVGPWRLEPDGTAAGGKRAWIPDMGTPKMTTASANPTGYVEFTFNAEAGRAYRLWIRGKAENDDWANDSAHLQFSGALDDRGAPIYGIGTTSAAQFMLESCSGCGVAGWGWEDHAWGTGVMAPPLYFATTGPQKIRIQNREDGLSIDQIVLSAERYFSAAPGPNRLDTTMVPK